MAANLLERVKSALHLVMCVAAVFALVGVGFAAFQAREAAVTAANDADMLTRHAVDLVDDARESVQQSRHVMLDARLALDNVNKAAIAERLYAEHELPATVGRVNNALDAATVAIEGLPPTTAAATAVVESLDARLTQLSEVEAHTSDLLAAATTVVQHADAVVTDPHVTATLAHVDDAALAGASTMHHADATAADTQQAWHSVLHPSWPKRIGRAIRRLF